MTDSWYKQAPCRGATTLFFGAHNEKGPAMRVREAKAAAVCATCPFTAECREASRGEAWGVWAGREISPGGGQSARQDGEPRHTRGQKPIEHGTTRGYAQHHRRPDDDPEHEPCSRCLDAHARNRAGARSVLDPDEYKARRLAERERAKARAEGAAMMAARRRTAQAEAMALRTDLPRHLHLVDDVES